MKHRLSIFIICLLVGVHATTLLSCGGPKPSAGEFELVSSRRVDRTHSEFIYRVEVVNRGSEARNVRATVTSTGADTEIIEGELEFGDVPADSRVLSLDTFTLRQDRTVPFDPSVVIFVFEFERPMQENRTPQLDPVGEQIAVEGEVFELQLVALDPDGDALVFSLVQAPEGMSVDSGTGLISWTAMQGQIGQHIVIAEVTDPEGAMASQSFFVVVAAGVDRIDPRVDLMAPTAALAGASVRITADVFDDVGVVEVVFFVGELEVQQGSNPPFILDYNAPGEPGETLDVRVVARDGAGNEGEASATVTAVASPDETLPTIDALLLPPAAAPGESVTVRVEASDDRGVAFVRLLDESQEVGTTANPPFEFELVVPIDAEVGSERAIVAQVEDTSGNPGEATATLAVVGEADANPPTGVTLSGPVSALAGEAARLAATAVDDVGVFAVRFFADGVQIAEDTHAPFETDFAIPIEKEVGTQVRFDARALDFAQNVTDADSIFTTVAEPGAGAVLGEVYDDSTGLPLAGALVRVVVAGGREPPGPEVAVVETLTDARGRYRLDLPEGSAVLAIEAGQFSPSDRIVQVLPNEVVTPFDARLAPLAAVTPVDPLGATSVIVAGAPVEIDVPPGAFGGGAELSVTALSSQSLPAPLPLGWSPRVAVHLESSVAPVTLLQLHFIDVPAASGAIVAHWNADARSWERLESDPAGSLVELRELGSVVWVVPDAEPFAPVGPGIGAALVGVSAVQIPESATLALDPSPTILFLEPGARSDVSAVLASSEAVPSGTSIEVDFLETYAKVNGSRLNPEPTTQDLLLFRQFGATRAHFRASPSRVFEAQLLLEGRIDLEAQRPVPQGSARIGAAGGSVAGSSGEIGTIPPGALSAPTPVSIMALTERDFTQPVDTRFRFLAGFTLELGAEILASPAHVALPEPGDPTGEAILVVSPVQVDGETLYELVALASVTPQGLEIDGAGAGLPLTGVRSSGRYFLLALDESVGFITGQVLDRTAPSSDVSVATNSLPFVSLLDPNEADYAVPVLLGGAVVSAFERSTGSDTSEVVALVNAGEVAIQNLTLESAGPRVVATSPSDGERTTRLAGPVIVSFSRPVQPASVGPASVQVGTPGSSLDGTIELSADRRTAVFLPNEPFPDSAEFEIRVAASVLDDFGSGLDGGNQPDGSSVVTFSTVDLTPPSLSPSGELVVEYESADTLRVEGAAGVAEPGVSVTVLNQTTGGTATAIAGTDGSFSLTVTADPTDLIELLLRDGSSNETRVGLDVPIVPVALDVDPTALLLLTEGVERPVNASVGFSDGSVEVVSVATLIIGNTDPAVAEVTPEGTIRSLADGGTTFTFSFGTPPFAVSAAMQVEVRSAAEVVIEETVGSAGATLEDASGVVVSIPPGALDQDVPIRVERIEAEGLTIDVDGLEAEVAAVYRFQPDIEFAAPVWIRLPVDPAFLEEVDPEGFVAVGRAELATLEDLEFDEVADSEVEFNDQFIDTARGFVAFAATGFSFRVVYRVGGRTFRKASSKIKSAFLVSGDPKLHLGVPAAQPSVVEVQYLKGKTIPEKPIAQERFRFVLWHATNEGASIIDLNLERGDLCPAPLFSFGQFVRMQLAGANFVFPVGNFTGQDFVFQAVRQGDGKCLVQADVQAAGGEIRLFASVCGLDPGNCPEPKRIETDQSIIVDDLLFGDDGTFVDDSVTLGTESAKLSLDGRGTTARKKTLGSGGIVSASQKRATQASAPFFVRPDGKIFQIHEATQAVKHTRNTPTHPTHPADQARPFNEQSTGIEIQHTGLPFELFSGPQMASLLRLTDFLLNLRSKEEVAKPRGRRRRPDILDRTYRPKPRAIPTLPSPAVPIALNLDDSEPVLTHFEQDNLRGRNGVFDRAGPACGLDVRKADPCPPFQPDAMVAGLDYDFPGQIDTRGGDATEIRGPCTSAGRTVCPGNGGRVVLAYAGRSPQLTAPADTDGLWEAIRGEIELNDFPSLIDSDRVDQPVVSHEISSRTIMNCTDLITLSNTAVGKDPDVSEAELGNLVIRGVLDIRDTGTCTVRTSGVFYLAPEGEIRGAGGVLGDNGRNLSIFAAGPVILHGRVDLSGGDVAIAGDPAVASGASGAGNGGSLVVASRADSLLQVPTVITHGGDGGVMNKVLEPDLLELRMAGTGGSGGNVTLWGAPRSTIVFSGLKALPSQALPCDSDVTLSSSFGVGAAVAPEPALGICQDSESDGRLCDADTGCDSCRVATGCCDKRPGLTVATNSIPGVRSFESTFSDERTTDVVLGNTADSAACSEPRISGYHVNHGLALTSGRGVVTSGGNGASGRRSAASDAIRLAGAGGGNGGSIKVGFFGSTGKGVIHFRGVALISGPGAGLLKERIPVALEFGDNVKTLPFVSASGGTGGTGTTLPRGHSNQLPILGGGFFFANNGPIGGNGGNGGESAEIWISSSASLLPKMNRVCDERDVVGHDEKLLKPELEASGSLRRKNPAIPKDVPLQVIGKRVGLCAGDGFRSIPPMAGREFVPALTLILDASPGRDDQRNDFSKSRIMCPAGNGNTRDCLAGGSGGMAGGGLAHLVSSTGLPPEIASNTESAFIRKGSAGRFGEKGAPGNLTLPLELWKLIDSAGKR